MDLWELGRKYNSVKCWARFPYAHVFCKEYYPELLEDRRDAIKTVLELGTSKGGSLRMWRDYFRNADIYGIDREDTFEDEGHDRIFFSRGEQQDVPFLESMNAKVPSWDIVIDDACHRISNMKTSYETLWPHVSSGGLYVVEDVINYHKYSVAAMSYFFNLVSGDHTRTVSVVVPVRKSDMAPDNGRKHVAREKSETGVKRLSFFPGMIVLEKE